VQKLPKIMDKIAQPERKKRDPSKQKHDEQKSQRGFSNSGLRKTAGHNTSVAPERPSHRL